MALFSWLTKVRSGIKNKTFPCEPSTIDEIHAAVLGAAQGKPDDANRLQQTACRISESQIPWANLRYFGFLGKEDQRRDYELEQNGFDPGIYIDRDGTALILIHQDDALIQPWVNRCGDSLQILSVYHADTYGLDVSALVNLQEVCMYGNRRMSSLVGLEKLTQLTNLYLLYCEELTRVPGLEDLTQLTALFLRKCNCIKSRFSLEKLKRLTYLELSDCRELTVLPGLEKLVQLTSLDLFECEQLTALPGLEKLVQLTRLGLSGCSQLTELPGLEKLVQLTELNLFRCSQLTELPGLEKLVQLTRLSLFDCDWLTALPGLEKLVQLTRLSLSDCDRLTALPGLEKLVQLTSVNLFRCSLLTELPGLEKLVQLTELNLSGCSQLTELPGLEKLVQLTSLNLSRCSQLTELPGLEKLVHLTKLDLSGCSQLTELPGLEKLVQLTSLSLSDCDWLTALPGLEKLVQLTSLDLFGCSQLAELPGLEKLVQLTRLNLSGCSQLTELPGLEKLVQLTGLVLSRCSQLTELPGLEKLVQLTWLNLSGCSQLTKLPGLEKLVQLTGLILSGCSQLAELPGLEKLIHLTELDLSGCSQLAELPGLEKLVQLNRLNLSGCSQLTELPGLEKLVWLTELDLSGCSQLTELPEGIRQITCLRKLNLQHMQLQDLPDWLPEIADRFSVREYDWNPFGQKAFVSLYGTTVEGVDMSIFAQPYPVVVEWFRKHKRGETHPLNEIKVVFLGDGEAGKSHTIARLMNDGGEPDHAVFDGQSTPGIVIRNKEYTVDNRTFTVHYWDFGGQEIMHSMHRIFLTGRTMYVILLNARDDTQSDRAKYWLHNVHSFAPGAPVLLVLNKIDQNENASVDERDLRGRYDKLTQVLRLSARDFTQEEFNNCFTNVLLQEIQKTGFLDAQWPTTWTSVKEKLENMETHYIMGGDYQAICAECSVDQNRKELLHWFNDLGVSFCCDGEDDYTLEDYVILRPDWITNALYIILFNPLEGARNGLIPHKSIYNLLKNAQNNPAIRCTLPKAKYTSGDIDYVLRIMRKFNLSFTDGHENEFIPMLCQQNSMVDLQYYQKDAELLEFNMDFDYLPNNLLHRLMVERYSELDMTTVWRTGAKFILPGTGLSAVVVIDGNTLRFFIRHTDPMHRPNTYLTMLKAHVERIVDHMGLQPPTCQLIYKLGGKRDTFDLDILRMRLDVGQTYELAPSHKKLIPIADILNQSAPDGLADEEKLLEAIRKSCLNIQAEPDYYLKDSESGWGMEDKRNRRIRDDLQMLGYDVKDQTQRGLSGTGRGIGELDLLLYNDRKEPWTIIEALRISSGTKAEWNKHLDKLVENYNYFGAPCLYLLTYVDADVTDFQRIWNGYRLHIPRIDPGKFTFCASSLTVMEAADGPQYVKTAKCRYDCGGHMTTAYHIFVRVPKQGEITP